MNSSLLILGGTGFIGGHIREAALAAGYRVVVQGLRIPEDEAPAFCEQLTVDLTDRPAVHALIKGRSFNYVINCSGYIDHTPFFAGGRRMLTQHFESVLNVIEALNRSSLRAFIQFGSCDEYGSQMAPQREDRREEPIAPYSVGKVAATHFLQQLKRTEDFPATILRIFLAYGPGQDEKRFLPQIIRGCLEGRRFPVSAGEQQRDFCYVVDIADAALAALDCEAARGQVINIASGEGVSIRSVIETVREQVGRGEPEFGKVAYRPGENMRLFADTAKAREILGWQARTSLAEGIRRTIEYYREKTSRIVR